jgi:hypothetical protein
VRRVSGNGKKRRAPGVRLADFGDQKGHVAHAAELVRRNKDLVHRAGGFGIVCKRGQKMPEFLTSALAFLSKRRGWGVSEDRLGKGPYAGRAWRVVWMHSRVLYSAVVMARAGVAVSGAPS